MKNVLTKSRRARRAVCCTATPAIMAIMVTAAFAFALPAATAQPARPNLAARARSKQEGDPVKPQNAQHAPYTPLTLKVSMDTDPDVVVGEPIVLHYTITNTSQNENEAVAADFGEDYAKLVTLKVVGQDGTALASLPPPTHHLPPGGFGTSLGSVLGASQSRDGFVVVTQRFALNHAGKYTLTVGVDVPYMSYNPNGDQMIDTRNLRATGLSAQGRYTYPLTVREAAAGDLALVASKLRRKFLAASDTKQKERLATALFSMSPNEALPMWKRLAYEAPASDRLLIAKALAQTFTPEAADILVKMEFNHPVQDKDGNAVSVMRVLNDMNYAGNPALKKHIKGLLATHRAELPFYTIIMD